jgi:O-antigen/teichoic acid export membrane protein
MIWTLVVATIELVVFVLHARTSYRIGLNFRDASTRRFKEMSAYTSKSFATILISSVFGSIDRLLAGKLALPVDFTSYTIASNLGSRLSGFSYAAAAPVFNNTSRSTGDPARMPAGQIYNETFNFLIGWYTLAVVGVAVWSYPVAHLWLGPAAGSSVAPFLPPLVLAYSLTAISIISSTQLGALDRVGTQAIFGLLSGLVTIFSVYLGWRFGALIGLAWGFLFSRIVLVGQDIFLIRLIRGGGWLSPGTWLAIASQVALGFLFVGLRNLAQPSVTLTLTFALLHGGLVSLWLLRHELVKRFAL